MNKRNYKESEHLYDVMQRKLKKTFYVDAPIYKRYKKKLEEIGPKRVCNRVYREFIAEINSKTGNV